MNNNVHLWRVEMAPLLNKLYWNDGSLSGEKYLKVAIILFFKLKSNFQISGLSNEILCILVAQETTKLTKLTNWSIRSASHACSPNSNPGFFSCLQIWPLVTLQPFELQGYLAKVAIKDGSCLAWINCDYTLKAFYLHST